MALEFQIIEGPSRMELMLAHYDPVPQEGRGARSFHRELRFVVANEPGRRLPLWQREFTLQIRGADRIGDLDKTNGRVRNKRPRFF